MASRCPGRVTQPPSIPPPLRGGLFRSGLGGRPRRFEAVHRTCQYRKLNSTIMVVKAADDRLRCDAAYVLDGTYGLERLCQETDEFSTRCSRQHTSSDSAQVRFAQDNHMVNALAKNRSDQPFGEARSAIASLGQSACRGFPWPVIGG